MWDPVFFECWPAISSAEDRERLMVHDIAESMLSVDARRPMMKCVQHNLPMVGFVFRSIGQMAFWTAPQFHIGQIRVGNSKRLMSQMHRPSLSDTHLLACICPCAPAQ